MSTPTQDLILEVLIARHRLGEKVWTFDRRFKNAVETMPEVGGWKWGVVGGTILVWLSDEFIKDYFTNSIYVAPASPEGTYEYGLDLGGSYFSSTENFPNMTGEERARAVSQISNGRLRVVKRLIGSWQYDD